MLTFILTTIFYIFGIIWAFFDIGLIFASLAIAIIVFFLSALTEKIKSHLFLVPIIFAAFLLGVCNYYYHKQRYFDFQNNFANKHVTITGIIYSIEPTENSAYPWQILCKLPESGNFVQLYIKNKQMLNIDDTVQFNNIYLRPCTNQAYSFYLMKENIVASVFLAHPDFTILKHPIFSLARTLHYARMGIIATIHQKLSDRSFALLSSLFFGNKHGPTQEQDSIKEDFKVWGISHYLARSGLHVVTLILLWTMFMRLLPVSLLIKDFLLIFFMIIYWLLSWNSISFLRAFMTFLAYKTCHICMLAPHTLHMVTLITLVTLLWNPLHLFFLIFNSVLP